MLKFKGWVRFGVIVAVVATGCSACSSAPPSPESSTAGGGTFSVGAISGILPYEGFDTDGTTLTGYEPDLLSEVANRLGMEVTFQVVEYEGLLPGLSSGRYDVAIAGFLDTAKREATYDGVSVTVDKYGFIAPTDTAAKLKTMDDLCGLKVGVTSGSSQAAAVEAQAAKCTGDNPLTLLTFDTDAQGFLALKSGQVDTLPSNVPLLSQFAKDNPEFAVGPVTFNPGPTAFFFPKGSALAPEVQKALQGMIDDGTYADILSKWDVDAVATDKSVLNLKTNGG